MKEAVLSRRQLLKGAGAVGVLGALGIPTTVFADDNRVRWDIMHITFAPSFEITAGGVLSPRAQDNSKITLTGSGTFRPGEDGGVTGGGTWMTFDPNGTQTGGGNYQAKGLVSWDKAPGALPAFFDDDIGNLAEVSAGLALLKIRYSDGSHGVLTVSCNLSGTAVFEGVTATKGFVDYWQREKEDDGAFNNRTVFHLMSSSDD